MKIAIDISPIIYGTGVSVYTRELVKNILELDHENEYILYGFSLRRKDELVNFFESLKSKNASAKFFNLPPTFLDILWNKFQLVSIERLIGTVDIVHTSDWLEPPVKNAKKVTTVHDLTPLLYPEYTNKKILDVHRRKLDLVKKQSDKIIAVSNSTKKDLIKLGFNKSKIEVIFEAANPAFKKLSKKESESIFSQFNLPDNYALMVGTAQRKNIENTLQAFKDSASKHKIDKIVVVGGLPEKPIDDESITYLDFVSDRQLSALYSQAELFLYTSIYEGFGLPILEAFKLGTPVVASNVSSMPEVALDAAVLVDPLDIKSISSGIIKAMENKSKLITLGKDREKDFSWSENAKRTINLYNILSK